MSDYRSYQQVISLSIRPNTPNKVRKSKAPKSQPKIRTKTGCLTCRKRKKKCDEHIVDGKCQGCTRNFLDCNWPVLQQLKQREEQESLQSIPVVGNNGRKSSVSSVSSDASSLSLVSNGSMHSPSSPRDSYPSPKSPSLDDMPIKLPPLRFLNANKTKESIKPLNFVITSLDDNKLCSIKH